jgi:hypothetical protein
VIQTGFSLPWFWAGGFIRFRMDDFLQKSLHQRWALGWALFFF